MKKGFIAFIALVLISIFNLFLIFNFSHSTFYLYGFINDEIVFNKLKSILYGCGNLVLLKLFLNSSYNGEETINFEDGYCYVEKISIIDNNKLIKIKGNLKNYQLYLKIIFDQNNRNIISWELSTF